MLLLFKTSTCGEFSKDIKFINLFMAYTGISWSSCHHLSKGYWASPSGTMERRRLVQRGMTLLGTSGREWYTVQSLRSEFPIPAQRTRPLREVNSSTANLFSVLLHYSELLNRSPLLYCHGQLHECSPGRSTCWTYHEMERCSIIYILGEIFYWYSCKVTQIPSHPALVSRNFHKHKRLS